MKMMFGKKKKLTIIILSVVLMGFLGGGIYRYMLSLGYQTISVDGIVRQYRIHIPANYDEDTPVPLVIGLHGAFGNAKQFEDSSGLDAVSDSNGFIIAYPDGLGVTKYKFHYWNSGHINPKIIHNVNDSHFIISLIHKLESEYKINTSRIYLTGHSNGACMAYRLAAEYSGEIAAVVSVSGTIGGLSPETNETIIIPGPKGSVNIVEVHGVQDEVIPYNGGEGEYTGWGRSHLCVNETINFWARNNGCNTSIDSVENHEGENGNIVQQIYSGGSAEVTLIRVNNGKHSWQSLNNAFKEEFFLGSSLAQVIWNELSQYSLK
ncbi:MAG: alpha/beta hydrolase family esterase [Promethearchaeota archaeon]